MVKKIKISDLAKDLNVPGNDIAELMGELSDAKKKPSSALNEEEINLVLEHYTQQNQVTSFDAYFEQRNNKQAAGSQEKPQKTEEKKPEKPEKTEKPEEPEESDEP